jgi:CHAT domain-containing protein
MSSKNDSLKDEDNSIGRKVSAALDRQRQFSLAQSDFQRSLQCYETAQETLADYPEHYLDLIQDLIKVHFALHDETSAAHWRETGLAVLDAWLDSKPVEQRSRLELKFAHFGRIRGDLLIKAQRFGAALEAAEHLKNSCLKALLKTADPNLTYAEMRQLLNPSTAIVYWHLSDDQLTTFLITDHHADPAVVATETRQLQQWIKAYDEDYERYGHQAKSMNPSEPETDPVQPPRSTAAQAWRSRLPSRLNHLKQLLNIEAIETKLAQLSAPQTPITQLILVPHRDLHRFPLPTLFSDPFTATCLPSLQVGLQLSQTWSPTLSQQAIAPSLLIVQDPRRDAVSKPGATLRKGAEPMRYALLESAVIHALYRAHNLTATLVAPDQASLDHLTTQLPQHSSFHFTGHGSYNARQPQLSALGLTGDAELTAAAIAQLPLPATTLITLSTCETALTGQTEIDAEYIGLPSAFLQAGATHVLSTLWTVEEVSNAYLMIRFYQILLTGESAVIALKSAQTWLQTLENAQLTTWLETEILALPHLSGDARNRIESQIRRIRQSATIDPQTLTATPYADPYHWAAFTLTGGFR